MKGGRGVQVIVSNLRNDAYVLYVAIPLNQVLNNAIFF
jgi:hypothetical protein